MNVCPGLYDDKVLVLCATEFIATSVDKTINMIDKKSFATIRSYFDV